MSEYIDDLIRRSDAIKAVENVSENYTKEGDREWHPHIDFITQALVQVPSISPKQGEWIVDEGGWKGLDYYPPKCKCNQCGYEEELYIIHVKPTNFCPNCGCQVKVADNE